MGDVVLKLESETGRDHDIAPIDGGGYGAVLPREEEELPETPSSRSSDTASASGESSIEAYDG